MMTLKGESLVNNPSIKGRVKQTRHSEKQDLLELEKGMVAWPLIRKCIM